MPDRIGQPILLVEDSPEDYESMLRAFQKAGLANPIVRCATGDEALDFLHRRGTCVDAPSPGIILLDLNLPGTDGREVLQDIKRTEELQQIPVVVLTTSNDSRDVTECYRAGANSYIQKPVDVDGFLRAMQSLRDYWFEVVILPRVE
jgi:two-component system, response regulator